MKIVWAIPTFENPQTGGEKAFSGLAELLQTKGASIIETYQENEGRRGSLGKVFVNFRNFKRLVRHDKESPIFQNLYNRAEFLLCNIFLHILFRRKIILFIHEVYEMDNLPLIQRWLRYLVNYIFLWTTSLVVVNSEFSANWVCSFGNFRRKIFLMYPVINATSGESGRVAKSQDSHVNILCVGNIRKNKGQIYLLQAMNYIPSEWKISFVGLTKEEDYMVMLKEYIDRRYMSNKVRFTGFLTGGELWEEYEKAEIFVSPTLKEGFGLSVLEAMSYGLPVVASATGGILEQVTDGKEGFLVPPGDSRALSSRIRMLIDDPELRKTMGALGRKRVEKVASVDRVVDQFHEVVARLCRC